MGNNKNRRKEKVEEEKKKELGELRRDKDTKMDEEKTTNKSNKKKVHPRSPLSHPYEMHRLPMEW